MDPPRAAGTRSIAEFGAGSISESDLEAQPLPATAVRTKTNLHFQIFIGGGDGRSEQPGDLGDFLLQGFRMHFNSEA
jgi:hypothetical protein